MAGFFKKALGLFVEFEEEQNSSDNSMPTSNKSTNTTFNLTPKTNSGANNVGNTTLSQAELDKFEKHFDNLFEKANLQGPDYYEFWKMMETLETHIPDEAARISAVYASLTIQGMSKSKLIDTAKQYIAILEKDKAEFEKAASEKAKSEIDTRRALLTDLEKMILAHSETIKKLTQEIGEAQNKIGALKNEIADAEGKISGNKGGYNLACEAMLNKITHDIKKIETTLK